ncbi:TetR/AcrR family transcriptional regulator [Mycolicibacterium sp.]|uniref:TetR/AcrR family transcriptional regulator n=1 Tax=Mycolicibacterium sp. TaxID=2320850 RepID=UPI001A2C322C|nr:TetR/AcrR family transcriptional regulator [Mycolicibacterium sp.]MBJ7339593.1 TetR/AcrR family transcriptional regulator C-terminal domain-containing protein [Mycolicibacterium sp.]
MSQPRRQQASGRRRRRTQAGTELSRDTYVDAAVNLIEQRGAAVLSARTLAAAVGADPSALYRHFTGIDGVLQAVADRMIGIGLDRWSPGADWLESLASLARALFAVYAHDFPRTGFAVASRTTGLPNEIRAVELTLGLLNEGGFDDASAAKWFVSLSDFMLGQAMLHSASVILPSNVQDADNASWLELASRLTEDAHPHTEAAAPHLSSLKVRSSFETSLELILRGLAASSRH